MSTAVASEGPKAITVNVSNVARTHERIKIEKPWKVRTGHSHKAAVAIYGKDDFYRDGARWTWLEHVWDRERDAHIEIRREKSTGDEEIFRKQERISERAG